MWAENVREYRWAAVKCVDEKFSERETTKTSLPKPTYPPPPTPQILIFIQNAKYDTVPCCVDTIQLVSCQLVYKNTRPLKRAHDMHLHPHLHPQQPSPSL